MDLVGKRFGSPSRSRRRRQKPFKPTYCKYFGTGSYLKILCCGWKFNFLLGAGFFPEKRLMISVAGMSHSLSNTPFQY